MADSATANQTGIIISTSAVTFITGFLLGIYSIRGYLISPDLRAERAANLQDPIESDESDIDEDDTILDHAPNWSNGLDADRKQGLRVEEAEPVKGSKSKNKKKGKKDGESPAGTASEGSPNEECKLVLVVRTDLGMTKGTDISAPSPPSPPLFLSSFRQKQETINMFSHERGVRELKEKQKQN